MDRCANLFYNMNKHKGLLRQSRLSLTGKTRPSANGLCFKLKVKIYLIPTINSKQQNIMTNCWNSLRLIQTITPV
jgi:hypothetical protein